MSNSPVYLWCIWLSALVLVISAIPNLMSPPKIRADFVRWGYPPWFGIVAGIVELAAGTMLLMAQTRVAGWALSLAVVLAVLGTLIFRGDYQKTPPAMMLLLLIVGAYFGV
jgi:uncharacterized membrane protein YphA (DoxX/SURF4 family)